MTRIIKSAMRMRTIFLTCLILEIGIGFPVEQLWSQSVNVDSLKSTTTSASTNPGNEFESTRVVAIVGGEPIFVGDMLFEINQLISRFMPNAPAEIKARERSGLINKLLPKYIEQKMLLIDVKRDLPEGATLDDVIESAADEFDDKALDQLMESAGVDTPIMFDAHLRAQGSSLRKL